MGKAGVVRTPRGVFGGGVGVRRLAFEGGIDADVPSLAALSERRRDMSLVAPKSVTWAELAEAVRRAGGTSLESLDDESLDPNLDVRNAGGSTLESLEYLDTFQGGNVPEGYQSVHFRLRFRYSKRTLSGEEVDRVLDEIVAACETRFGATLRT